MKKILVLASILVISFSACFAVGAGPTIRSTAMGGTGIATANDISAAYFNPAGLMFGTDNVQVQAFGGGAIGDITHITDVLSDSSNFITKYFSDDISGNASINGGLGVSVKKVGVSAFVIGNVDFHKPANALSFSFDGNVNADMPLTLGSSFSTPGLPIAQLAIGVNLKAIQMALMNVKVTQSGTTGAGSSYVATGSGFGFDIGAQAKITPLIMVGAVIRNLSASVNMTAAQKNLSVDSQGNVVEGTETDTKTTFTPAPETGIGAGVIIPLTGTLIAMDLENYSAFDSGSLSSATSYTDTHFGVEQEMFFNTLMLRVGYYTYGPTKDTFYTYGFGLNLGPVDMGIAAANSVNSSLNSIAMAQLGVTF